nr:leucine-rich repeat protein [Mycoplasmopsis bovis]
MGGFNTLRNLEEFEFNDQLEEILDESFLNFNLTSLKLPNSLKILGGFQQSNITDLSLNEGLIEIKPNSFAESKGIKRLSLPQSLKKLGGFQGTNILALRTP